LHKEPEPNSWGMYYGVQLDW